MSAPNTGGAPWPRAVDSVEAEGGAERRVILKVTVEVEPDRSDLILVREGDAADALAEEFCRRNGLQANLAGPLAAHILENMRRAGGAAEAEAHTCAARSGSRERASSAHGTSSAPATPALTPRGARTARQRTPSRQGGEEAASRFEWLHQDATQRRCRLERLRRQVERDIEDQRVRGAPQIPPGTLRCAAWHRDPDAKGSRLYQDAAQRQLKIRHLQEKQATQRRREEEVQATFHPTINASQRSCHGVGRSARDPEGQKTRTKLELLREMRFRSELHGCTFRPEIDHRSEELMAQRLARMKITGSLYDALYEDALRRKERLYSAARTLPPEATFQPDIGADHFRPPNDDTREDFVNRLAYSKSYSERWLSMRRQAHEPDAGASEDFRPQTGRGPLVERNKAQLPIGEFLYEAGRERALQSQQRAEERSRSQPSTPRVGEASQRLFEETKRRKYKDLYDALVSRDAEGKLRSSTLALGGLNEELREFLRPMTSYLAETGAALEFEAFCVALDCQRQHSVTPTAHLFVQKSSERTSSKYRAEQEGESFVPQLDQHSARMAGRRRPRSAPLHEQLHRERESRDWRLEERRLLREERELQECTFQPNAPRPRGGSGRATPRDSPAPRRPPVTEAWAPEATPSPRTPRRSTPRRGGPPQALIDHISLSQRGSGGLAPEFTPRTPRADAGLSSSCREQICLSEQAVAHCRSAVAAARQAVAAARPG